MDKLRVRLILVCAVIAAAARAETKDPVVMAKPIDDMISSIPDRMTD